MQIPVPVINSTGKGIADRAGRRIRVRKQSINFVNQKQILRLANSFWQYLRWSDEYEEFRSRMLTLGFTYNYFNCKLSCNFSYVVEKFFEIFKSWIVSC